MVEPYQYVVLLLRWRWLPKYLAVDAHSHVSVAMFSVGFTKDMVMDMDIGEFKLQAGVLDRDRSNTVSTFPLLKGQDGRISLQQPYVALFHTYRAMEGTRRHGDYGRMRYTVQCAKRRAWDSCMINEAQYYRQHSPCKKPRILSQSHFPITNIQHRSLVPVALARVPRRVSVLSYSTYFSLFLIHYII